VGVIFSEDRRFAAITVAFVIVVLSRGDRVAASAGDAAPLVARDLGIEVTESAAMQHVDRDAEVLDMVLRIIDRHGFAVLAALGQGFLLAKPRPFNDLLERIGVAQPARKRQAVTAGVKTANAIRGEFPV